MRTFLKETLRRTNVFKVNVLSRLFVENKLKTKEDPKLKKGKISDVNEMFQVEDKEDNHRDNKEVDIEDSKDNNEEESSITNNVNTLKAEQIKPKVQEILIEKQQSQSQQQQYKRPYQTQQSPKPTYKSSYEEKVEEFQNEKAKKFAQTRQYQTTTNNVNSMNQTNPTPKPYIGMKRSRISFVREGMLLSFYLRKVIFVNNF